MAVGWSPAGGKGWWSLKGELGYWMTSILPPVFGSGKREIIAKRSSEYFQTTYLFLDGRQVRTKVMPTRFPLRYNSGFPF